MIVVAGFLGSGKTTLLNQLLRKNGGTRIGVLVNDFGSINIDSMLVAGQVDSMVSLGNGCLCCAVDASELDEMLDRLARPGSPIDVIVVEASGLAEPVNLIRMVIGSTNPRISYGGLVEVVDAAHFPRTRARHPELLSHLRLADLVVLNKADLVPADELSLLRHELERLVRQVPVYPTAYGRLDPGLLFDPPEPGKQYVAEQLSLDQLLHEHDDDDAPHQHLHDGYDSVSFTSARPLDPRRVIALLEDPPIGLFRAKGFLSFAVAGERRKFLLHLVGRHVVIEPRRPGTGQSGKTELVFVGMGIDADDLRARLAATVHADDEPLPTDALLGVHRYIPG